MSVQVQITGDKEVIKRLQVIGSRHTLDLIKVVLEEAGGELVSRAQALVSGQLLRSRKGRLRAGIKARVRDHGDRLLLFVGPRSGYPYALAIGSKKSDVEVKGYVRRYKPRDVRAASAKTGKTLKRVAAAGVAFVKPSRRRPNLPPRPFMLKAFSPMRDSLKGKVSAAVGRSIRESA